MQHILMILPQCHDCALYKELVAIANRLILDPVGLSYFLSQHDLYLGQTGSLNKLSAAERQQLQLYLKPELQALLHSAQGRQIGEDFAANRIRSDQNTTLPPGSLDLLRFLVAETQLSGTTDIKENFLQPVRPDLVEVYQRWRYNKTLPGDNYLLPYFQLYDSMDCGTIKANYDQFKAGDDNDGRDGLEADFSIFYVIAKPWLVLVEPQYYDSVRQSVLTKLADGIITPSLADRIFQVLPHNSATATYRIWIKLVEDLDTEAARAELTELLSEVVVENSSQLDTTG